MMIMYAGEVSWVSWVGMYEKYWRSNGKNLDFLEDTIGNSQRQIILQRTMT